MKINILTQFHGLSIIRFVKNGEVRNMLFDEKDLNALENEDATKIVGRMRMDCMLFHMH